MAAVVTAVQNSPDLGLLVCRPLEQDGTVHDLMPVSVNATTARLTGDRVTVGTPLRAALPALVHDVTGRIAPTGAPAEAPMRWSSDELVTGGTVEVTCTRAGKLAVLMLRERQGVAAAHPAGGIATPAGESSQFRALVEEMADVLQVLDAQGRTRYISPAMTRLLGYSLETFSCLTYRDFVCPEDHGAARETLAEILAAAPADTVERKLRMRTSSGQLRWVQVRARNLLSQESVAGIVVTWQDVTEREQLAEQLQYEAGHDPLTGLPNRRIFRELLDRSLARADRMGSVCAVFFCDLDDFKIVNDTMGHPAGDDLLVQVARRLQSVVRPSDTVARFGGDEFVVLAEDLTDDRDALALAQRMTRALDKIYEFAGTQAHVSVSMGIGLARPGTSAEETLSEADAALYSAKRHGRGQVEMFDTSLRAALTERMRTDTQLRHGLAAGELRLHYQPTIDLREHRLTSAEALLRWEHPELGLLGPDTFLPVAEESDLILGIGRWVVDAAISQLAKWQQQGATAVRMSINLSDRQLTDGHLPETIADALSTYGVPADSVQVEISERLLATDMPVKAATLRRLRDSGVHVALDDFGAGYSSMAWLEQLPVDSLKLDRRLIARLAHGPTRAIVNSVISLSHTLGLSTVAEGVETAEQLATLSDFGCDYAQGFYFEAAQPPERLTKAMLTAGY